MELPVDGRITTRFDTWVTYEIAGHPTRIVNGQTQWKHEAIDIVTQGYQPIKFPSHGVITKTINAFHDITNLAAEDHNYGNEVRIKRDNGYEDRFCHCKHDSITVHVGQEVQAQQQGALTGQTGYHYPGTTIHTHWELYDPHGNRVDPLDPKYQTNQLTQQEMEQLNKLQQAHDEFVKSTWKRLDAIEDTLKKIAKHLEELDEKHATQAQKIKKLLGEPIKQ